MSDLLKVQLTLSVAYRPNGLTAENLKSFLEAGIRNAIGNGLLTADTVAEVETYNMAVEVIQTVVPATGTCQSCGTPLLEGYCQDITCAYSDWPQSIPVADLMTLPAAELTQRYGVTRRLRIEAKVWDDSRVNEAGFDAALWFAQADSSDIESLQEIGWSGDYASDAVAEYYDGRHPEVTEVFNYIRAVRNTRAQTGFECSVDEDSAKAWLKVHRPGVRAILLCTANEVSLVEAQEPEIAGMWDWLDGEGNACAGSFATREEAALNAVAVLKLSEQ